MVLSALVLLSSYYIFINQSYLLTLYTSLHYNNKIWISHSLHHLKIKYCAQLFRIHVSLSSTLSLFTFSCNFVDIRFQYKLCFRYSVLFISSNSQDSKGLEANVVQQFSLDDTRPSFGLFSRYILMLDHTIIVRFVTTRGTWCGYNGIDEYMNINRPNQKGKRDQMTMSWI